MFLTMNELYQQMHVQNIYNRLDQVDFIHVNFHIYWVLVHSENFQFCAPGLENPHNFIVNPKVIETREKKICP